MKKRIFFVMLALLPTLAQASTVQEVKAPKSGITAWLVEEHSLPLLSVKIAFRDSGSAYDAPGKGGRANMAASLLMEGAGDMDATQFARALDDHAVRLDFAVDDDTFRASLSSLSENSELAFGYLGLALGHPRFDADAVTRVKSQVTAALEQAQKDPTYLLQRQWAKQVFGTHPYANPELGTAESVAGLTKENLAGFTQDYLTRDHMVIAVVGDITPEALATMLDAHLGGLPATAKPDVTLAEVQLPSAPAQTVVDSDIPQTVALFGTQGIARSDPAFYDAYVMNYLIGGESLSSLLFTEIRNKRGLTYSIGTQLEPLRHGALWSGEFATRNEKVGEALAALRQALAGFAATGPSDDDLARAKQFITGSFVLGLDSNASIANYLIIMQTDHLGRDYLDKRNGLMQGVTREGVKKIAAQIADPAHMQVVMVGKPVLSVATPDAGVKEKP